MYAYSVTIDVEHALIKHIRIVGTVLCTVINGFKMDIIQLVSITVQLVIISALDIWVNLFKLQEAELVSHVINSVNYVLNQVLIAIFVEIVPF